ncbi:hypothetical protein [Blastomonas sp. SL216]|uniref:hypothetical protein n=1 Tax=Blastomonas sp. SL216 TaxID=2995169 RepID=UPI00237785F4|nr:hypothetical protein OU999_04180 [Blastomonas sp. SL216]
MAIIGQNYGRRRRPIGPFILVGLAVVLVALLALAWSRGGEVPTQRVEKSIPLPAAAKSGAGAGSTQSEG